MSLFDADGTGDLDTNQCRALGNGGLVGGGGGGGREGEKKNRGALEVRKLSLL